MSRLKKLVMMLAAGAMIGCPAQVSASAPQAVDMTRPQVRDAHESELTAGATPFFRRSITANPSRATIALALGGGGVRGAAHIGVLRVLEKEGIPVDYIAGSSMGAIVGGMYAAGASLDSLEQMFRDRSVFKALTPVPLSWRLITVPPRMVLRSAKGRIGMKTDLIGLYSKNKMADFVNSRLSPNRQRIEQTLIPFAAVATNLLDGKTFSFESGNIGKAVQASSAIPFYVKPIRYEGKLLVDGGLRANVPTQEAKKSGADIVISVNVNETMVSIAPDSLRTFKEYSNRVTSVMLAEMGEHQVEIVDLEIRPAIVGVNLYSDSAKDALQVIRSGEEAAIMAIPAIRELMNSAANQGNATTLLSND